MSGKPKKKLCWNCEGNVSLKAEACPYCGVSLVGTAIYDKETSEDSFNPPYKMAGSVTDQSIPAAPYATQEASDVESQNEPVAPSSNDLRTLTTTLVALLFGSVFIIFGLILLLFSDQKNVFTLQWNGTYWYVYLLLGLPLLFIGWKTSAQIQDQDEG